MIEVLLGALLVAALALTVAVGLLHRRLWLLMRSVECLCSHISQVTPGGHAHDG